MDRQQLDVGNAVMVIVLAAIVLVFGDAFYLSQIRPGEERSCLALGLFAISILLLGAFGLWLSLIWPGRHLGAYILIGVVLGGVGILASIMFFILFFEDGLGVFFRESPDRRPSPFLRTIVVYGLGSPALLGIGGGVGDFIKPRATRPSTETLVGWGGAILSAFGAIIGGFFC